MVREAAAIGDEGRKGRRGFGFEMLAEFPMLR
jgi:hypothetical protein